MDSAEFIPYWRENVCDTKGVWCSLYRGDRTTAVVSNLTNGRKTATLAVGPAFASAKDLISGRAHEVKDGRLVLAVEPFTPYVLALE